MPNDGWECTPSGVYAPAGMVRERSLPVAIDLFAGCGGFSLGFMQAGFEVIAGLDNDPAGTMTYMHNLGTHPCQFHFAEPGDREKLEKHFEREFESSRAALLSAHGWIKHHSEVPGVSHFFFGDAKKFSGAYILHALGLKRGEVDVVMGGPPCQGFSIAGKRNVMDPRNSLVFEFARLVLEIWPKTFVFENVPSIVSMITPEGMNVMDTFCQMLDAGGYGAYKSLRRAMRGMEGARAATVERPPPLRADPKGQMRLPIGG